MSTPTIKIAVSQADATLVQATTLTSGMQNLPVVKFYFTDEWAGLGKTAVFIAGSVALEVLVVNNQAVVPAECLETAGVNLTVGIYGANTQIVLPTVYCSCGEILTGTDVGDASNVGEPTTELVDQMLGYAAEIEAVADTLDNLAIRTVTVNTDGANHYGIASVTLSDTGSGEDRTLTFAFSNLKGNGIESITWSEAGEYRGRIQITESNGTVTNFDALIEAINYLENLINRAEAWAVGTIDGVPVEDIDPDDPAYQNNAKYYAEMAEDAGTGAEAAQEAAETAQGKAEDAQEAAEAAQAAAESAEATATAAASSASGDAGSAAGSASSAAGSASSASDSASAAASARDAAELAQAAAESSASAASGSASSASTQALKSEGFAVGKQNDVDVDSGSTYYHNNAKYYKEQAADSATAASGSASNASSDASAASGSASSASTNALKAEGYAVGKQNGTDVASGSPYYQNNSKYFKEEAEAVLESIPEDYSDLAAEVASQGDKIKNIEYMPFIDKFPDYYTDTHSGTKVEIIKNTIKCTKISNSSTYTYHSIFGARYLGTGAFTANMTDTDFISLDTGKIKYISLMVWRTVSAIVASNPNSLIICTKDPTTGVIKTATAANNSTATVRPIYAYEVLPEIVANKNIGLVFRRTNANDQSTVKIYTGFTSYESLTGNFESFDNIASKAYNINELFQIGNSVYKVTQPIAQGETITPNTNCIKTSIGAEITAILNS